MNRALFLLHRYLGIALGLVMSIWCLSGIVMMYVQYPELDERDQAQLLAPLALSGCCQLPADLEGVDEAGLDTLRIEQMAGRPVLRLKPSTGPQRVIDLRHGQFLGEIDQAEAMAVAQAFADTAGIESFDLVGLLERDQWTVYGAYNVHRPLYKFAGDDGAQWYVSSQTGEVIQHTTASQRFWNWLGAVPHWLYPTLLRQHTFLWSQTVIWLTIFGTFLTVVGIYVGVRQYKTRRSGRRSPYRGVALVHHYAGLLFGALTLTWMVSGFFSMNPWGALESRSFAEERSQYRGAEMRLDASALAAIRNLGQLQLPAGVVKLDGHRVNDERFFVAWHGSGERSRLDAGMRKVIPIAHREMEFAPSALRPGKAVRSQGWIREDDAYYYEHHEERTFPVYRIVYEDGERYYLDHLTGELLLAVDSNSRWYRWLHYGLHRGDFAGWIRERPVWDLLMLTFMAAVTVGALTGTWMGTKRVLRGLSRSVPPRRKPG